MIFGRIYTLLETTEKARCFQRAFRDWNQFCEKRLPSGGFLLLVEGRDRLAAANINFSRLELLGNLAGQLDHEQAVFQVRMSHVHMVGQFELAFE